MGKHILAVTLTVSLTASAIGQTNLLTNPTFNEPTIELDSCTPRDVHGDPDGWVSTGQTLKRKGSVFIPPCPHGAPPDYVYASFDRSGTIGGDVARQLVTLPTPATGSETYAFSGDFFMGANDSVTGVNGTFRIWPGPYDPAGMPLKTIRFTKKNGQNNDWQRFRLTATPPAGTEQLTVEFGYNTMNTGFVALHVDNMDLSLATDCLLQPHITSVVPTSIAQGTPSVTLTLTGTDFSDAGGTPIVTLRGPEEIVATSVVVDSATKVTATFNTAAATNGEYDIVYSQGTCTDALYFGALLVYLTEFTNGSFESPAVSPCTPAAVTPTAWFTGESNSWGIEGILHLNGYFTQTLDFLPTCPWTDAVRGLPSSSQYGTMATTDSGGNANAYQTAAVTQGTRYSLSGYFASSGNVGVDLTMKNGSIGGTVASTRTIQSGGGSHDWQFHFVDATAGSELMTFEWHATAEGSGLKASHADLLAVEVCSSPVGSLTSITPDLATNGEIIHATITGTGFVGTPRVFLNGPGKQIEGTNVVATASQITCDFDMNGAPNGHYDVLVKQGGCYGSSGYGLEPFSVWVVASEFVNGDFEDPEAPLDCGPPPVIVGGIPTGWNSDGTLNRDGNAPMPPSCPSPAGGHYGTMSAGENGFMRAWQTVRVVPGQPYEFSGYFAGMADCVISLLDGDENGDVLETTEVYLSGTGEGWIPASVSAVSASDVMTVMWEVLNTTIDYPGGHADGLQFGSDCNEIWADADNDGDVDMDDFAHWQRCLSIVGGIREDIPYCRCFDRVAPFGQVDLLDLPSFLHCTSGPGVPWTDCDP